MDLPVSVGEDGWKFNVLGRLEDVGCLRSDPYKGGGSTVVSVRRRKINLRIIGASALMLQARHERFMCAGRSRRN